MLDNDTYFSHIQEAAAYLQNHTQYRPAIGIVLGSGLGALADHIENADTISYADIPHFKRSTAIGHKGNLIFGTLGGKTVVAMQGRFHYYEGYTMQEVTLPIRVMSLLGVKTLLVSNAAGGINTTFQVGDLMIIRDHINMMPNPLVGPNMEQFGVRFPDMTTTYSRRIALLALDEAQKMHLRLQSGVYIAGTGPSYETIAEYRFFGIIGADAVGMSTVPEVIVARHCGMEIFGMSVITNQSNDLREGAVNDGNDVIEAAKRATNDLTTLFMRIIERV